MSDSEVWARSGTFPWRVCVVRDKGRGHGQSFPKIMQYVPLFQNALFFVNAPLFLKIKRRF